MSFTFGSFGDIVALAQIINQIVKALSDSTGASVDYQQLIEELRSFSTALHLAHLAGTSSSSLNCEAVQSLVNEIAQCASLLSRFSDKIKGYRKALGRGGSGSSWRKVGWGLFKTEDVASLRAKIAACKGTITLFLVASISRTSGRLEDESRREDMAIKIILNRIWTTLQQLPKTVAQPTPDGLKFSDALGRNMTIPFEFCRSWEDFEVLLKMRFKNRPGYQYVNSGRYRLVSRDGQQVHASEWQSVVKVGMEIDMSIIIRATFDDHVCPACGTKVNSDSLSQWFTCCYWEAAFQISKIENGAEQRSLTQIARDGQSRAAFEMEESGLVDGTISGNDIRFLKRISILLYNSPIDHLRKSQKAQSQPQQPEHTSHVVSSTMPGIQFSNFSNRSITLNNYLQSMRHDGRVSLSWIEQPSGPPHAPPQWNVQCKFNGEVIGEATAHTKAIAKEAAAALALEALCRR